MHTFSLSAVRTNLKGSFQKLPNYVVRAVLRQRLDRVPYVIYYASIILNDAQLNFSTTKKINASCGVRT